MNFLCVFITSEYRCQMEPNMQELEQSNQNKDSTRGREDDVNEK